MSTGIEWTDETWNPVTGCTKVSPGCDHCYAETITERFHGKGSFAEVKLHRDRLLKPLRWRKPRQVFVNSMSDLFHDEVPDEFIAQTFAVMALAPQHTFQVLTKRPGRMRSFFTREMEPDVGWLPGSYALWAIRDAMAALGGAAELRLTDEQWSIFENPADAIDLPLPNVWLGTSVEDQKWANVRIPRLMETPAAVRFLSCEPLLGPVMLPLFAIWPTAPRPRLDWCIVGGESGHGARPMDLAWARSLRDQCTEAGVPFFLKQLGGATDKRGHDKAILDGATWNEMPDVAA